MQPGNLTNAQVPSAPVPSHHPQQGAINFSGTQQFRLGHTLPGLRDTGQTGPMGLMRIPNPAVGTAVGHSHSNVPQQAINSIPVTSAGASALAGPSTLTGMQQQYRNYPSLQQAAAMDVVYPPNRTATSNQLPFYVNSSVAHGSSIHAQHSISLASRVQQHMDYGTGSYPLNLSQPTRNQTKASSRTQSRKQMENDGNNAGMRLPTASKRFAPGQQQSSSSPSSALPPTSSSHSNRQVNVITIQPEGTAPHEDPSFKGQWPWVKAEPVHTGYDEPASSFTNNLQDGGSLLNPIIIEPDDEDIDSIPQKAKVTQQIKELHVTSNSTAVHDTKPLSEPVCDRDEFQKVCVMSPLTLFLDGLTLSKKDSICKLYLK